MSAEKTRMRAEGVMRELDDIIPRLKEASKMKEELKMYEKNFGGDRPPEYLYGPSWKAMELLMEGGYKTPEEAKKAWEEEQNRG